MPENASYKTVKNTVRDFYSELGKEKQVFSCCGVNPEEMRLEDLLSLGYSPRDIVGIPPGSRVSLGCGNLPSLADLKPGELVLDIGCGAGLDMFLVARRVGRFGFVVGADMASTMIRRARKGASQAGLTNMKFVMSEAEHLPYKNSSFDVAISNCVINLCPGKERVFQEMYRVLKSGGRICVSDVISIKELSRSVLGNIQLWTACVAGTVNEVKYLDFIRKAGFIDISVLRKKVFKYGTSDIKRFKQYFQGDNEGFQTALSLEGNLGTISLMAHKNSR